MQGINKAKHVHLMDALLKLERILNRQRGNECSQETVAYRTELETMHQNYERLLDELAGQITVYDVLYSHVKIQFLGKKLKELKKEILAEKPAFVMLQESIRLTYGT